MSFMDIPADTGCAVSPSCLRCHLPRCVEDEPVDRIELKRARDARKWRAKGMDIDAIAERLGVARRTVFRYLADGVAA